MNNNTLAGSRAAVGFDVQCSVAERPVQDRPCHDFVSTKHGKMCGQVLNVRSATVELSNIVVGDLPTNEPWARHKHHKQTQTQSLSITQRPVAICYRTRYLTKKVLASNTLALNKYMKHIEAP